jgi:uncharacterized protein DUF5818
MRKLYLITAMLLLSAVWVVAQTTPGAGSPQSTSPSATSPSQQPATQDTTQSSQTSTDSSIEGCLGGSAGNWTLTDQTGKTWQLAGDTSKLGDHAGHQVRITGSEAAGSASSSPSSGAGAGAGAGAAGGAQPTFTVKKVKMVSSSCSK